MADNSDNPAKRILENPIFYGAGSAMAIVASYMNWFDSTFLLIILPAAAYGTYHWFKKRRV